MSDESIAEITVRSLDMAYGDFVVMRDLHFDVGRGDIFIIMGGSGCGKSTLLKHLVGLKNPARGEICFRGKRFSEEDPVTRDAIIRSFGVLYQGGALWSSMTLAENVAMPLELYTNLSSASIREIVRYKLALVGLSGSEDRYPAELSGGMRKRAGLARAMALDPQVLFFDEPGAGLDPISSRRLDDLILELSASLKTTIVVVTHELASIFAVGNNGIFLDAQSRTCIARGSPKDMLEHCEHPRVQAFLRRGESEASGQPEKDSPKA